MQSSAYITKEFEGEVNILKYSLKSSLAYVFLFQHVLIFNYRAWNSKSRQIFRKPFDSRHCTGASSKIVCYDCDVTSGSLLSVRRDPENKRIYFNINGKEEWVTIGGYAQSICYGYARLTSIGNDSKIEVTLIRGKKKEGICEITTFFNQGHPTTVFWEMI